MRAESVRIRRYDRAQDLGGEFGPSPVRHPVESTCLRIDDVWAGLKFTHPTPGKTYTNSYGTLPDQRS